VTARWTMVSWTWWRPSSPVSALRQRRCCGKTHCQRHSQGARGYLRAKFNG
jgi:hypothetical protein